MTAAEKNVLIAIALFVLGLLSATNWTPSTAIDKGIVSPAAIPENLASTSTSTSTSTSAELVSSVNRSKIKQESMASTF